MSIQNRLATLREVYNNFPLEAENIINLDEKISETLDFIEHYYALHMNERDVLVLMVTRVSENGKEYRNPYFFSDFDSIEEFLNDSLADETIIGITNYIGLRDYYLILENYTLRKVLRVEYSEEHKTRNVLCVVENENGEEVLEEVDYVNLSGGVLETSVVPMFYVDIDTNSEHKFRGKEYPTIQQVLDILPNLEIPFTTTVDSANGVHVYFGFKCAYYTRTLEEKERVTRLILQGKESVINDVAKGLNKTTEEIRRGIVDKPSSIADSLRLPNSINKKKEMKQGVRVEILETNNFFIENEKFEKIVSKYNVPKVKIQAKREGRSVNYINGSGDIEKAKSKCNFIREFYENPENIGYNEWISGPNVFIHFKDGCEHYHEACSLDDYRYDFSDTESLLENAVIGVENGIKCTRCSTLRFKFPHLCGSCTQNVWNPHELG